MGSDYNTLELARIYENQGYLDDAFAVYTALDRASKGLDPEVRAACQRMTKALGLPPETDPAAVKAGPDRTEGRINALVEEWATLLVREKQLSLYRNLKQQTAWEN